MDYSDQVSAFMNDYDEKKSAFYTAQSFGETEGKLQETAGGEIEGIGVGVGTVAYKAAGKLGLNDIADPIIKRGLEKGTSFLKDQANNLATKAKNYVQSKTSVNNETDATGNVQDRILNSADDDVTTPAPDAAGGGGAAGGGADSAGGGAGGGAAAGADAGADAGAAAGGDVAAVGVGEAIGAVAAEVIPVVGLIGSVIAGIVELVKGHHEEKNNNNQFVMPTTQVDLPSYHPGIN